MLFQFFDQFCDGLDVASDRTCYLNWRTSSPDTKTACFGHLSILFRFPLDLGANPLYPANRRLRTDGETESRHSIKFPGLRPVTEPLQPLPGLIRNGRFGRLCRGLDYVEPRPASCANRPPGAEGAECDLHIIKGFAGSRSASRVPDNAGAWPLALEAGPAPVPSLPDRPRRIGVS